MATAEEQLIAVANSNLDEATKARLRASILDTFFPTGPVAQPNLPRVAPGNVEIGGTNSENETLTDTLYRASQPGFRYGEVVADIARPYLSNIMDDEALEADSPMLFGQGYTSNLRHGVGTGLVRDKIMELISPLTEAGREYNPDDPSFLTKAIANVGATGATLGEELADAGRYAKEEYKGLGSFLDPEYYKKIFTQPYEDVMANLQGILYGGYGNTPQQKFENLLNLYTTNQGIFTPALNRLIQGSDPSRVVTQQNLIDAVTTAAGQTPVQQAIAQQQAETQQKIIDEVKQSGGGGGPAGMVGTPTGPGQTGGPAGMGFAPSNNPTGFGSNIRIGKANGGIVSLFGRF
jgi:hypothetical protein